SFANIFYKPNGIYKPIRLVEKSVLHDIDRLVERWCCIKMVGDHINRNSAFMIFMIQKIFEPLRVCAKSQCHADKFCLWRYFFYCTHNGIVLVRILLRGRLVLEVRFV